MAVPIVLADADVLYAAPLRDLLLQLAVDGVIRLHWSDAILGTWQRALRANRPDLSADTIARTGALMAQALPYASVAPSHVEFHTVERADSNDCHAIAAAVAADAHVIVTFNVASFPPEALAIHNLVAIHPDAFLAPLAKTVPELVQSSVAAIRARLRDPRLSINDYLTTLARLGLPNLAIELSRSEDFL